MSISRKILLNNESIYKRTIIYTQQYNDNFAQSHTIAKARGIILLSKVKAAKERRNSHTLVLQINSQHACQY